MKSLAIQTVLHVDDDSEFHEIFYSVLEELKVQINYVPCTCARTALWKLKKTEFTADLIILDLNMPVMDGHEFLAEVKQTKTLERIPVIIFSTSSHPVTIQKTKQLGAHEFISKPGSYTQLLRTVSGMFL